MPRCASRRSLGTGDEALALVERTAPLVAQDACRTVVEAIADALVRTVGAEAGADGAPLLLAGGSARNAALRDAIAGYRETTAHGG